MLALPRLASGLLALVATLAPPAFAAAPTAPQAPPDTLGLVLVPAEAQAEVLGYRLPVSLGVLGPAASDPSPLTPPPPGPFSVSSYRALSIGSGATVGSFGGASVTTAVMMLAVVSFLPCGFAGTCDVPDVSDRTFEAVAFAGSVVGATLFVTMQGRQREEYAGLLRLPRPDVRPGDTGAAFLGVLAGSVPGAFAARAVGRQLSDENKPASFVVLSLAQGAGAAVAVHLRRQAQERRAARVAYAFGAP